MKSLLIVSAAAACIIAPNSAHALFGAGDTVFCLNCSQEVTDIANHAETIAKWVYQAEQMDMQFQQAVMTYQSITGIRNVYGVGSALNSLRSTGTTAAQIPQTVFGSSAAPGASQFSSQNKYYDPTQAPTTDDFASKEIIRKRQVTANFQADAQEEIVAVERRKAAFDQFSASVQTSPDLQNGEALSNRLAQEKAFLANSQSRFAQMQTNAMMATRVDAQRGEEAGKKDAESLMANTAWAKTLW